MKQYYHADILAYLAAIVQKNTHAYPSDFDLDMKTLWNSAAEAEPERRTFLWMSRPHGTWCVLEREVFLDDTNANCIWTHYAEQSNGILAYRVVVEGVKDGKLFGAVSPVNYEKQVQRVLRLALPIKRVRYVDEAGRLCEMRYSDFQNSVLPYDRRISFIRYLPEDETALQQLLQCEHRAEQLAKRSQRANSISQQRGISK